MLVKGDDYVGKGIADYEAQVRKGKERALRRLAMPLALRLSEYEGTSPIR